MNRPSPCAPRRMPRSFSANAAAAPVASSCWTNRAIPRLRSTLRAWLTATWPWTDRFQPPSRAWPGLEPAAVEWSSIRCGVRASPFEFHAQRAFPRQQRDSQHRLRYGVARHLQLEPPDDLRHHPYALMQSEMISDADALSASKRKIGKLGQAFH